MSMAKHVIRFPRAPQFDPHAPIKFASLQVGQERLVFDLRGPKPKFRSDQAEVISIKAPRQRARKGA
jgi:hypothetical protein